MPRRSTHRTRRGGSRPTINWPRWIGAAVVAIVLVSGVAFALFGPGFTSAPSATSESEDVVIDLGILAGTSLLPARQVYPHSVVPGGLESPDELKRVVARDPVVATHYAGVAVDRVRVERLAAPRHVYVSYRKGNQIYWTKNKLTVHAGERILTDGTTTIRGRCGNCISEQAMLPTSDDEPAAIEFDRAMEAPLVASRLPDGQIVWPPAAPLFGGSPAVLPSGRVPNGSSPASAGGQAPGGGGGSAGPGGIAGGPPGADSNTPSGGSIAPATELPPLVPDNPTNDVSQPPTGTPPGVPPGRSNPNPDGSTSSFPPGDLLTPDGTPPPWSDTPGGPNPPGPGTPDLPGGGVVVTQPVPVPEPASLTLLATGIAFVAYRGLRARRRKR